MIQLLTKSSSKAVSRCLDRIMTIFEFVQEYYPHFFIFHIEGRAIFNDLNITIKLKLSLQIHMRSMYFSNIIHATIV
jgi:hypothetical protein